MKKIEHEQNEYAEDIKGKPIYILDAESGRKGYFCIGCKNEMQAVKSKIKGRKSYFRHDATDIKKNQRKCTFSNQNYRHSQAILILNRIKRIKVPTLYKFPPKNSEGKAYKLRDSHFINAKYTKAELTFYETDEGDVKFGKNPEVDSRNLLIRPDVTFFNAQNEPILLIEIVVTHKIDSKKLAKIRRLGIDMVQITIPKDSLENIEKSLLAGQKIKWIYNNEQERTEYIFLPKIDSEGVSQIDELQREFFEESFECRKSQISNLIRAITKCVESQHYRGIEKQFRKEILRAEINTERTQNELKKVRNRIREKVHSRFEKRRRILKAKREEIEREEKTFEQDYEAKERNLEFEFNRDQKAIKERSGILEERYLKRRGEIEKQQKEIRESIIKVEFFESSEAEYREKERAIGHEIESIEARIERDQRDRRNIPLQFKQLKAKEHERFEHEKGRIRERRKNLPSIYRNQEDELETEFREIRERRTAQIKNEDYYEATDFSSRLKKILATRDILNDWDEKQLAYERNKAALGYFRKGTYKNWS